MSAAPPTVPVQHLRGVIFDLDGTLFDSLADIADAANAALHVEGCPAHPLEAYRKFVGEGVRVLFEKALPPEQRTPELVTRCANAFSQTYAESWNRQTRVYDGIDILLDQLAARGLPLAVLSNKPDPFTRQCVEHFFKGRPFVAVVGQSDGTPRKPDPTGALLIARKMELPPGEVAFVGDSSIDMQTARNAGMFAVGVSWGFRSVEELWMNGAQAMLAHPRELLPLLD